MITLYIKTHRITGLKYFGKTERDDPFKYKGSGLLWRRHIKKHGYDIDTEIYFQTESEEEAIREAVIFSKVNDIVNSDLWANLTDENGIGGWVKGSPNPGVSKALKGVPKSKEHIENAAKPRRGKHYPNISKALKGISFTLERCEKISKALNGRILTDEHRENIGKGESQNWIIVPPSGDKFIVTNLRKFCDENDLHFSHMYVVAQGKRKQHKGYKCKKVEGEKT